MTFFVLIGAMFVLLDGLVNRILLARAIAANKAANKAADAEFDAAMVELKQSVAELTATLPEVRP